MIRVSILTLISPQFELLTLTTVLMELLWVEQALKESADHLLANLLTNPVLLVHRYNDNLTTLRPLGIAPHTTNQDLKAHQDHNIWTTSTIRDPKILHRQD